MDRAAFAARSRVIFDICAAHGVWLDAAELPPIVLHFQRLERGEIEEDPPPTQDSFEAVNLREEITQAERNFDNIYERRHNRNKDSWSGRDFHEELASAHRHLRELRERLVAVRIADRAARKSAEPT
jgi:Zn-finger nucleic acid-binding protein